MYLKDLSKEQIKNFLNQDGFLLGYVQKKKGLKVNLIATIGSMIVTYALGIFNFIIAVAVTVMTVYLANKFYDSHKVDELRNRMHYMSLSQLRDLYREIMITFDVDPDAELNEDAFKE